MSDLSSLDQCSDPGYEMRKGKLTCKGCERPAEEIMKQEASSSQTDIAMTSEQMRAWICRAAAVLPLIPRDHVTDLAEEVSWLLRTAVETPQQFSKTNLTLYGPDAMYEHEPWQPIDADGLYYSRNEVDAEIERLWTALHEVREQRDNALKLMRVEMAESEEARRASETPHQASQQRFRITWTGDQYRVNIPNYDGGEVVEAAFHDSEIERLQREREEFVKANTTWLVADGPGGWIDELRKRAAPETNSGIPVVSRLKIVAQQILVTAFDFGLSADHLAVHRLLLGELRNALDASASEKTPAPLGAWMVWYEDKSVTPEIFFGHGAEEAAKRRFKQARDHWSCHLFMQVTDSIAEKTDSPPCSCPGGVLGMNDLCPVHSHCAHGLPRKYCTALHDMDVKADK